ncbi:hypothetical protein SEA_LEOPARD_12 [Mycobacterium phage Leopard]|nr:hypothetical protein SEA_LEOPARD_12 [Mycobacterium phage Leopard]
MRASVFGSARHGSRSVISPWGKPIPMRRKGSGRVSGSSTRKPTPDPSLWGMKYKPNDPLAWPLENPAQRSDLEFDKTTTAKANFNNAIVNKAFQRGGYAG